ncbi:hypothetical protein [Dyella sp. A6]|uniref:hypothetical protein n=1 Tax=Dyella aluminiiresistens TaxID=3069105 RepID=UPI002E761CD6|nr:hypothetical protein [Dyella sp. A6]
MTELTDGTHDDLDYIAVSREAHQLATSLGNRARFSALGLAEKAKEAEDAEAAKFWRAVYDALRPR